MKNVKTIAIIYLLISAIIIGFSFVVIKTGLKYASPYTILVDRLLAAFLVMVLLRAMGVTKIDKISAGQKTKLFFLSQMYPLAFFLFTNIGVTYISASETSILYSLLPILTTIVSAMVLKEKTTGLQRFGIFLSFSGMAYISIRSFTGLSDNLIGYAYIFVSLLSIVFFYVFLKQILTKASPITITYYNVLFATITSVAIYGILHLNNTQLLPELQRFKNLNYISAIFYLGVMSTFLSAFLNSIGIKDLSPVQASIFSNISPFFGILAGVLIMGDTLKTYQVIGATFIFLGMFISIKYAARK